MPVETYGQTGCVPSEYVCEDISGDGARFAANFKIDVFGKRGWQKIELLPAKVAIVSAKLPKHAYLHLADGMYYVLTDQKGEIDIELAFAVAPAESDGTFSVLFERVPSVTCSLDATFADEALVEHVEGGAGLLVDAGYDPFLPGRVLAKNADDGAAGDRTAVG